jgi:3-methyladenine DNA glycosylase Tag
MLTRSKGRDFYDSQFLLGLTQPDYSFLTARLGIRNAEELEAAISNTIKTVDLATKVRDFEHLLFNRANSRKILLTDGYNTIAPMGLK